MATRFKNSFFSTAIRLFNTAKHQPMNCLRASFKTISRKPAEEATMELFYIPFSRRIFQKINKVDKLNWTKTLCAESDMWSACDSLMDYVNGNIIYQNDTSKVSRLNSYLLNRKCNTLHMQKIKSPFFLLVQLYCKVQYVTCYLLQMGKKLLNLLFSKI